MKKPVALMYTLLTLDSAMLQSTLKTSWLLAKASRY